MSEGPRSASAASATMAHCPAPEAIAARPRPTAAHGKTSVWPCRREPRGCGRRTAASSFVRRPSPVVRRASSPDVVCHCRSWSSVVVVRRYGRRVSVFRRRPRPRRRRSPSPFAVLCRCRRRRPSPAPSSSVAVDRHSSSNIASRRTSSTSSSPFVIVRRRPSSSSSSLSSLVRRHPPLSNVGGHRGGGGGRRPLSSAPAYRCHSPLSSS